MQNVLSPSSLLYDLQLLAFLIIASCTNGVVITSLTPRLSSPISKRSPSTSRRSSFAVILHQQALQAHMMPTFSDPIAFSLNSVNRGGGGGGDFPDHENMTRKIVSVSFVSTIGILLAFLIFQNLELLTNKERIQNESLELLRRLNNGKNTNRSLVLYSLVMAFWELCSLTTIPVETAAGIVFGWQAAPFSIAGKVLGAGTAFGLGRTWLKPFVTNRLASNSVWKLVTQSKQFGPWTTAFLMKYSCFPEFIKNFGSSFLSIRPSQFVIATIIHGGGFSLLWTWWGVETALKLAYPGRLTPSNLKVALTIAGFVGVVATPALMAWWINCLRIEASERESINSI